MTKKTLITLIILAVVLTVLSFLIIRRTNKSYLHSEQAIGSLIFPDFNLDKIKSIEIIKPDNTTITLDKKQSSWVVKSLFNYPANSELLSSLLEETANLKVIQNVQTTPNAYNNLNLTLPSPENNSSGTEIKFLNNKNKTLYSLIIGKKRIENDIKKRTELTVGRYIKTPNQVNIYLTDELFDCINFTAEDWLFDRNIAITDIEKVELSKGSEVEWTLFRNKHNEEFQLEGASQYTDINRNKIKSIIDSLNNLKFNTVAKSDLEQKKTGLDNPVCLQVKSFNGTKYELKIGNMVNNLRYVKYTIITPPSEILTKNKKALENLTKRWIYLIDINRLDPLLSSKASLLTPEKYKSSPASTYSQPIS